jgi:mono/diheme cytochrome c family protein
MAWRLTLAGAALLLGACATPAPSASSGLMGKPLDLAEGAQAAYHGDAEVGLLMFNEHCLDCHSATRPQAYVGPSLYRLGAHLTPSQARLAIEQPSDEVAAGFAPAMPATLAGQLPEQGLNDILAYLLADRP